MPISGFIADNGEHVDFADVISGIGTFSTRKGDRVPRPLLRLLARQYRDTGAHYGSERAVSATELIAPTQQRVLLRRHEVYVQPLDNLWAAYGTLMHLLLEGAQAHEEDPQRYLVEQRMTTEFDGSTIAGTVDYMEQNDDGSWQGWDYKVMSAYGVKQMVADGAMSKPEYFWQANIYAWLNGLAGRPVSSWNICAISRDYNERMHGAKIGPVEVIPVPLALDRVPGFVGERIALLRAAEMCEDGGLPECSAEETWDGKRCAKYCSAAAFCHQLHPELDLDGSG